MFDWRIFFDHWRPWAVFAGYLLVTWLVASLARRLMKGFAARLAARSNSTLDDRLVKAGTGPIRLVVHAVGLSMAISALGERLPVVGAAPEFHWVVKGVGALLVLAITALANALLKAALDWYLHELAAGNEATWDEELVPVVRRVLSGILYFLAAAIILDMWGQNITALVTTAGVASLAVALAAQETLSNMLGGLILLVDRPFKVGDVIELTDGRAGEVGEIGLRSTHIRQFDGTALVVPNKDMANSRIINYALPTNRAAIRATLWISYNSDVEKAKAVLLRTIQSHPEVLKDPEPGVWFTKFGASTLELFFSGWVDSYKDRFRVTDELNLAILKAFRENGIEMAFPQQGVHVYMESKGRTDPNGES